MASHVTTIADVLLEYGTNCLTRGCTRRRPRGGEREVDSQWAAAAGEPQSLARQGYTSMNMPASRDAQGHMSDAYALRSRTRTSRVLSEVDMLDVARASLRWSAKIGAPPPPTRTRLSNVLIESFVVHLRNASDCLDLDAPQEDRHRRRRASDAAGAWLSVRSRNLYRFLTRHAREPTSEMELT